MSKKILVIGDFCTDKYTWGEVTRINPEAPTPIFVEKHFTECPGMAGNVLANLASLGNSAFCLSQDLYPNIVKHRYVDINSKYILMRVDSDKPQTPYRAIEVFHSAISNKIDALVISDYNKGAITEELLFTLPTMIKNECNIPIFLDTKKILGGYDDWEIDYIKINHKEYLYQLGRGGDYTKCKNLIVTLGDKGSVITKDGGIDPVLYPGAKIIPLKDKKEVACVTGAGDVYLAALVTKIVNGGSLEDACEYANDKASESVTKSGTGLATK